ncbi:MAG TPA: tetratricopeptide repeat protein, partial [Candidatus Acidoferrales bacterium]|nr:tetratricopeptide repeat protein [Candidatus Acidoferrales bacterium]
VPLDWGAAQNNLGLALASLGKRESGTQHLQEAVEAYRAALEELTREQVPLDWGAAQNNLGLALESLGERESGTQHLQEAVAAFEQALRVFEAAPKTRYVDLTKRNLTRTQTQLQAKQNSEPRR